MKLGAEPKKLVALAVLVVIAGITYYVMSSDDSAPAATTVRTAPRTSAPASVVAATPGVPPRRSANRNLVKEFKPGIGVKDPKDRPDPASIDPTIRWDLLAKVQNLEPGAPGRNLFQFGSAPPPPAPPVKLPTTDKIAINKPPPLPPPTAPPGPAPAPQAPPMTFKYYGYKVSRSDGHKAAFLLDGEEILIAGESDTVKKRYKIIRISVGSIVIEDTQFKSTQTLPLQENLAS